MPLEKLWPLLAVFALVLPLHFVVRWAADSGRRKLLARHRELLAGGRVLKAARIGGSELDTPLANPMQRAWRGFVVVGRDEVRFVGLRRSAAAPVTLRFDRARHRLAMFQRRSTVIGLPTLLRVGDGTDPHFLYVDGTFAAADEAGTEALFAAMREVLPTAQVETDRAALPGWLLAAAAIVPMLALVGLVVGAAFATSSTQGPRFVATGHGSVVVVRADDVLRFDESGRELSRVALGRLGLDGVTDVRVTGPAEIVVGDTTTGVLHRCDLARARCEPHPTSLPRFDGPFSFVPAGDGIVAVATLSHKVFRDGSPLADDGRRFCSPRGVALARDGRIVIGDTGNYRLVAWGAAGAAPRAHAVARVGREERCGRAGRRSDDGVEPLSIARGGGVAPTSLAEASDGRWWVVANTTRLREGDVLLLDAAFEPVRSLELPRYADPASVAALGDTMLVADPRRHAVYRFDRDGRPLEDFARAVWDRDRRIEHRWLALAFRLATPALVALFAVLIGALALGTMSRRRRMRELFRE